MFFGRVEYSKRLLKYTAACVLRLLNETILQQKKKALFRERGLHGSYMIVLIKSFRKGQQNIT